MTIMVATDIGARGLDFNVEHVIMFDFPLNSVDYLHRAGRTARFEKEGYVTNLLIKRDLVLAHAIQVLLLITSSSPTTCSPLLTSGLIDRQILW